MTQILLVTTATDLAADLIAWACRRRGIPFSRLNQEDFPHHVSMTWRDRNRGASIVMGDEVIECHQVRSSWFRSDIAGSIGSEANAPAFAAQECAAFLNGFWDTLTCFWINRPSAVSVASRKLRQLELAARWGFRVPVTTVTNCPVTARDFVGSVECIAKAVIVSGFTQDGQKYAVYATPVRREDITDDAARCAPVIYQERIAKAFDLRVTVVGMRVFAAEIRVPASAREVVDWRAIDPAHVNYRPHALPPALEAACIAFVKTNSLVFAALDFIVTPQGDYVFLELNPSGQWGWIEHAIDAPITEAIVDRLMEGAA